MPARKQKNKKKHHQQQQQQQQLLDKPSNSKAEGYGKNESSDSSSKQSPFRIEKSTILGRYVVANRDLKAGELLITEEPLVIGPCVSADAVCLGCYMPVELEISQYRCAACKWPMCGPQCRGLHQPTGHTAQECELLSTHNLGAALSAASGQVDLVKNFYELVLIARICLLKQQSPDKYADILQMESHTELRKANTELWQHYEQNVVQRLQRDWGMRSMAAAEIHTICGILDVNCFEIGQNSAKARCLYRSAFLLAHDCCPNTAHADDPQTYAIILRTSRAIRKDEGITLSYAYTLQGTLKRREFMHAGKLFWCSCSRCADPKELGTDCSALVCPKCRGGSVRTVDPLNQEAEWKCDRCDYKLQSKEIVKLLDAINTNLESIDAHNIPGLEAFLKKYERVLGPNHYLLLSAKYLLCQIYGRIEGYLLHTMPLEDVEKKENYCRDFLRVVDALEPGMTRLRGLILYELHGAIMMRSQRLMMAGEISESEFKRNIKNVIRCLQESRDIMLLEPEGSSEREMGVAAAKALVEMGVN
ncbi:PREDICTED: protein msta-like isoform X1 [Rhagoletis zephyria]|uniref:protein msta-like isoform X1 n=2 Tax=Rhagoletis zephyria TaxID=28612 RepID=UPI0008119448|nr:PREDICTED: protein msta-like isoform X1 [Rhagoletis zephyria]XP_017484627.1 PREDICTED: protein msta-like isoform X1 [Rhagoletis zephyria]